MDTENNLKKFKELFCFLQETKCLLSICDFNLRCVIHISPDLTLSYRLEEDLTEKLKEFLRMVGNEGLDLTYSRNHFFIDYCVDKGWIRRKEYVKHTLIE